MKRGPRLPVVIAMVLCVLLPAGRTYAEDDARAYDAAVYLFAQTSIPTRDGRHNTMLLALRHLRDPQLAPWFETLTTSPFAAQRVHGQLGLAEISPAGRLDLATIAEIEDPAELTQLIGAALDIDLIGTADLTQVLRWESLDTASKQALAVRVVAGSGAVEEPLLRASLIRDDDDAGIATLLRHGLSALMLMERGDRSAMGELRKLDELGTQVDRELVQAQLFEAAMRHGFASIGPWAMEIASDPERDPMLRLSALRAALRFPVNGDATPAVVVWESMFENEEDAAQRVRLALTALEAAPWTEPGLYRMLEADTDPHFVLIAAAGQAIAGGRLDTAEALIALIEHGHPLTIQWAGRYANEHASDADRGAILLAIVEGADRGNPQTRGRRIAFAIAASQALAESGSIEQRDRLLPLLDPSDTPRRRGELAMHHIVLLGLVRAQAGGLEDFVAQIPDQPDADAADLALLLRARWGDAISATQWERVSQIVAGASSLDVSLRVQLAWLYLKHIGRAGEALRAAAPNP